MYFLAEQGKSWLVKPLFEPWQLHLCFRSKTQKAPTGAGACPAGGQLAWCAAAVDYVGWCISPLALAAGGAMWSEGATVLLKSGFRCLVSIFPLTG